MRFSDPAAIDEHFIAHNLNQDLAVATLPDIAQHTGDGQGQFVAGELIRSSTSWNTGAFMREPRGVLGMSCSEPAPDAAQPFRTALEARLVQLTKFMVHGLLLCGGCNFIQYFELKDVLSAQGFERHGSRRQAPRALPRARRSPSRPFGGNP